MLSICLLAGLAAGRLIGSAIGVEANVGGVGFAMLLLIFAGDAMRRRGWLEPATEGGVRFWSSIYIPIVVALAAGQNVRGAVGGGAVAVVAGVAAVGVAFALVPVLAGHGGDEIESPGAVEGAGDRSGSGRGGGAC